LKEGPKSATPHNNLGDALVDQGNPDEAVAECRKTIELDPKSATFLVCALDGQSS
jgi:Flp pilus assembly protein TadD